MKYIVHIFVSTAGIFHYSRRRFVDSKDIEKQLNESTIRMNEKWHEFSLYNDWNSFLGDTKKGIKEYQKRISNG